MALQYCSQHERLFVFAQDRWIAFTQEEVSQIEYLYEILEFSNLEVVETACDECAQGCRKLNKPLNKLYMLN